MYLLRSACAFAILIPLVSVAGIFKCTVNASNEDGTYLFLSAETPNSGTDTVTSSVRLNSNWLGVKKWSVSGKQTSNQSVQPSESIVGFQSAPNSKTSLQYRFSTTRSSKEESWRSGALLDLALSPENNMAGVTSIKLEGRVITVTKKAQNGVFQTKGFTISKVACFGILPTPSSRVIPPKREIKKRPPVRKKRGFLNLSYCARPTLLKHRFTANSFKRSVPSGKIVNTGEAKELSNRLRRYLPSPYKNEHEMPKAFVSTAKMELVNSGLLNLNVSAKASRFDNGNDRGRRLRLAGHMPIINLKTSTIDGKRVRVVVLDAYATYDYGENISDSALYPSEPQKFLGVLSDIQMRSSWKQATAGVQGRFDILEDALQHHLEIYDDTYDRGKLEAVVKAGYSRFWTRNKFNWNGSQLADEWTTDSAFTVGGEINCIYPLTADRFYLVVLLDYETSTNIVDEKKSSLESFYRAGYTGGVELRFGPKGRARLRIGVRGRHQGFARSSDRVNQSVIRRADHIFFSAPEFKFTHSF